MHETILKSGWDTVLFAVPFLGLLLIGFFRLDEIFASNKKQIKRRPAVGMDPEGEPYLSDPDGRMWRAQRRRK